MYSIAQNSHFCTRTVTWCGLAALWLMAGCEIKPIDEPSDQPVITATPAPAQARPAEVGVGIQGQSLRNEKGIGKAIAQPAVVLFQTKEKIVFDVQIPQAMSLFKASEGRTPESHDEFMAKIIKANQIPLPKLPAGQAYRYRPDEEQLYVEPIEAK